MTREEAAAILYRYAQFGKLDVSKTTELSKYGDANSVSSWAQSAVKWTNAVGFIKGTTAVTLSPNGSMTRAQAATVLMRLSEYSESAVQDGNSKIAAATAAYLLKTVSEPQIGSIGGEWAVIGLARSGYSVPQSWIDNYYAAVEKNATSCKGVLSSTKYTEYSRVIIALTAIGKAPDNVNKYNLLSYLADYNNVVKQGLNGSVWALIALDSGNYVIPENSGAKVQATREMYVDGILSKQLAGGGFSLTGEEPADADMTAMALCALSRYKARSDVTLAIEKAVSSLSKQQLSVGAYSSCESAAQVIIALCSLGISTNDSRFIKNGATLKDELLSYYIGEGQFRHISGGEANQMATEQALLALAALQREENGKSAIYNIIVTK